VGIGLTIKSLPPGNPQILGLNPTTRLLRRGVAFELNFCLAITSIWGVHLLFPFHSFSFWVLLPCLRIFLCSNVQLQDEAAQTLQCFGKSGDSAFEDIFMTKIDFPARYDYCVRYIFMIWSCQLPFHSFSGTPSNYFSKKL